MNLGYWHIEISDNDRDKTDFRSHHGWFIFKRMNFGLKNAPGTSQRIVEVIRATVKWQFALDYLDGVIVFSSSFREHVEHVATIFRFLKDAGVTLTLKKCAVITGAVDYLGHKIMPDTLVVETCTKDAIVGLREPRAVT